MRRPWQAGLVFGVCLVLLFSAMGWMTYQVLDLERAQTEAAQQAELEEAVRLALWRMDSSLTQMIALENSRPYFTYSSFYPAQRAYTSMFASIRPGEVIIPSPLLADSSPDILLHFQIGPGSKVTSPQVPTGNMRDLAESRYVDAERIIKASALLEDLAARLQAAGMYERLPEYNWMACAPSTASPPIQAPQQPQKALAQQQVGQQAEVAQQRKSVNEFRNRVSTYNQQALNQKFNEANLWLTGNVEESLLTPIWQDDILLLVRKVSVRGKEYLQGCWLNWPEIRRRLLDDVKDLLPNSKLNPLPEAEAPTEVAIPRRLATLPVLLTPGQLDGTADGSLSPMRLSLMLAWGFALFAAAAFAFLLVGAVSLSERRGAFVSAVTHELRTPLTTFRMYADMLSEGMVPDSDRRQSYYETMRDEADRLSHLVENVLLYARLERGKTGVLSQPTRVAELVDGVENRLRQRCEQARMQLVVENEIDHSDATVQADVLSFEQILFNLVDNACKYAAGCDDRRVHVRVKSNGEAVNVVVTDHGRGIDAPTRRRLFQPFSKSAKEAANSANGVGLGLALSRQLARGMGGELTVDGFGPPTRFVLSLKRSSREPRGD